MVRALFCVTAIVMALSVGGCVPPVEKRLVPFDPVTLSMYAAPGTSHIVGQAFMRTAGGDVKLAAGLTVGCVPDVPYTRETYQREDVLGQQLEPVDPRVSAYTHNTVADGAGSFDIAGLPAGDYFVACRITWLLPNGLYTGGTVVKEVHVDAGQTQKIILTQ